MTLKDDWETGETFTADDANELAAAVNTAATEASTALTAIQSLVNDLTNPTTTYTPTNVSTDRSFDADATTTEELADVLGTLIADLKAKGIIAS